MNRLSILAFGTLEIYLDNIPVVGIESDKSRALLVYLAVHPGRPHRRDALAALLWPDTSTARARQNLRQALYNLREVLRGNQATQPFIIANRQSVWFNPSSNCWIDVSTVSSLIDEPSDRNQSPANAHIMRWKQAVQLYQGQFLDGFTLTDAEPFEEWRTFKQEELHCRVMHALAQLAVYHETSQEYEQARRYLQRQLELEPWREETHRDLMRVLHRAGHRSAALQQYVTCRGVLYRELGVEPEAETQTLYEHIMRGKQTPCLQSSHVGAHHNGDAFVGNTCHNSGNRMNPARFGLVEEVDV